MDRLRDDEQLAAEVLVSRLGGTIDPKDVGGAQATHEFDLVMADGHRIAVEVTSATDEDMERLSGEAKRRYRAPRLTANWGVWLAKDPRQQLKTLMPELPPLLGVLEQRGVEAVGRHMQAPEDPEAAKAGKCIARLGVHRAWRLAAPDEGEDAQLFLALHGGVGSDFDALNALVSDRIKEKLAKLFRANVDKRHLFVWVRHSGAWMAMTDLPPPPEAPELPPLIDVVWAATYNPLAGGKLYRLKRGGAWEAL